MPKTQLVDPATWRRPGAISFTDIPVNRYQKTVQDERDNYSDDAFKRILRDMLYIREFESMLFSLKTTGKFEGFETSYPGPAHLALGQEAAYVGMAYTLGLDDVLFGSHRSHGDVIARGLSAIEKYGQTELEEIMEGFLGGAAYKVVRAHTHYTDMKDIAREFLLYGLLAEILARVTGFNRGLGGSMHAFFIPFGILPNNALVGGAAPIATGAALYKRINKKPGIVIGSFGDGAIGCGPVYESMNFAAMDQLHKLWDDEHKGGLPILFNVYNNDYAMGGQTRGETMAYDMAARLGAGVSPSQLHAERIDGYNPLAVIDAYRRKRPILESGDGPVLLDIVTYRYAGHSPSDQNSYRTKEEIDLWKENDSIEAFTAQLLAAGVVASQQDIDAIHDDVKKDILHIVKLAVDSEISPRMDFEKNPGIIADFMLSNGYVPSMDTTRKPEVCIPKAENPRVKQIVGKSRSAYDAQGKPVSKNKVYNIRDAIFEAVLDKFYEDPTLVAYGEEHRDWGGPFAVYRGMTESLPYHRFFNAPISEDAICGSAVGYAMSGGRVLAELMYIDFLGRAGDEIMNQMSKWQAMSGGILKMPLVLRTSIGSRYGAQHSQDWSAIVAHIPGLKVVYPATPYDAKGLMNSALAGTDPVIFLESQSIYDMGERFHGDVPAGYYEIPIGLPDVKRPGSDLTILSVGAVLYRAVEAAEILEQKYGISAEVIDARSIVPFDYQPVVDSVKKTGRIVITGDACARDSVMKDFAATISELAFDYLDAPPVVVGAENWITPAFEYENNYFPQPEWIVDAVHEKIVPLTGHVCRHNFTSVDLLSASRRGI